MDTRNYMAHYISESFKPIRITASRDEWRSLKYVNKLFGANVYYDEKLMTQPYSYDIIKNTCVNFYANFHNHMYDRQFMTHPLTYISSIISIDDPHFVIDVYNEKNIPLTLDTKGIIPNRWIRMLADFAFKHAVIDENSCVSEQENMERWKEKIFSLPAQIVNNLSLNCVHMMDSQRLQLSVTKAPNYSIECDEYNAIYKKNTDNLSIKQRKWGSYDHDAEPATQIFFQKCAYYHSFNCLNEVPFGLLAACEGGISFWYMQYLPWSQFRMSVYGHNNVRNEVRGCNQYYPFTPLKI